MSFYNELIKGFHVKIQDVTLGSQQEEVKYSE